MHIRRIASAALVTALSATVLAGCGDESDGTSAEAPTSQAPKVLTADDLKAAVIRVADIGDGFRVGDDEDDDDPAPGCLKALDVTNDGFPGSDEDTEVTIEADTDDAIPEASQLISAFKDESAAEKALTDLADSFDGCTKVEETDSDGAVYAFDVDTNDDSDGDRVSDQFNVDTVGTITAGDQQIPLAIRVRFARVGNVITGVAISTAVNNDTEDLLDDLTDIALARLTAVIDGTEQPTPDPIDLPVFTG